MIPGMQGSDIVVSKEIHMQETTYDFKKFILFLRSAVWWLILGALLGAGLGYLASTMIEPAYQATTRIMITRAGQFQSSDFTTYLSDLQMTQTYVQLLTTETVLKAAADRLGVKLQPEAVDVHAVEDTQVIVLRVENGDPQQAALVANTIIEVLMDQNEIIQSGHYITVEQSLELQKTQIESALQDLQSQIKQTASQNLDQQKIWLEEQLAALQVEKTDLEQEVLQIGIAGTPEARLLLNQKNARLDQIQSLTALYQDHYNELLLVFESPVEEKIDPANTQLALLTTTQSLYRQYYVSILSELESVHLARLQNVPNIVQIEVASAPEEPIRPLPWLNITLGAVIGLVFMIGVVFLREALDDTVKSKESTEQLLGVPVIGSIGEMPRKQKDVRKVHISQQPHSVVAEDFRLLRTNLEMALARESIHTILFTSPQDADGKTTVAMNLAASLAQAEKCVVLLEADMRRPELQTETGSARAMGLGALLADRTNVQSATSSIPDLPHLTIIGAGEAPSNPAELLCSNKMRHVLNELKELADVVVIDSPPSFVADAQILARDVDAVILVVRPGVTPVEAARNSIEMFKRVGIHVMGIVMNRVSAKQSYDRSRKEYLAAN